MEEDAHVYVYDCRTLEGVKKKITIGGVFSFEEFKCKLVAAFELLQGIDYVITTTNRDVIENDDSYFELIEPEDTLYILDHRTQALPSSVSEKIDFQPHYDTLIKSGIYEYYASAGQINPLPFAFAELIDNALAATVDNKGPREIEVSLNFDDSNNGSHTICVMDNGKGMNSKQLNNWAIYRLSKFNRKEKPQRTNIFESDMTSEPEKHEKRQNSMPKSLNSDISWFGVGGKQAVFFIGSAARVISRPRGSHDVHEFTLSKDEFKRKEANRQTIYSGFIKNRTAGDFSHIPKYDEVTRQLIAAEENIDWKTNDVDPGHVQFMKEGFAVWTRQLAHIYHYYIHGPEGNTTLSSGKHRNASSYIDIKVSLHERGRNSIVVNLRDIDDDLESRYLRSASDTLEFKVTTDGGDGVVEGSIRYHPFLFEKETYPLDLNSEDSDEESDGYDALPARGRRPIFECFWNGRLIPYTTVHDFEWCRMPKKRGSIPNECFYRISGCLFANDAFQVSTNKLTFIDLEGKLRDRSCVFSRVIAGQVQRAQIQKQFMEWLKDCHEKYDKQVKFLNFIECFMHSDPSSRKSASGTFSAYKAIEWGGRVHKKGQLVRTQKVYPVLYGRIHRFILHGSHDGDVYAVGGEVEIIQEPSAIYGEPKRFPLSKLDRSTNPADVQPYVNDEEGKLPCYLDLTWPEGNEIKDGESRQYSLTIGAMRIEIHNRRGESIQKLPATAGGKKFLIEQTLLHTSNETGRVKEIASHITAHGRSWPYWFKKMENLTELGAYKMLIRTVLAESGVYTYKNGRNLPQLEINFVISEAPPYKFMVGMLQSPLCIGEPFEIPLELQDKEGRSTCAVGEYTAYLESDELEIAHSGLRYKGSSIILHDVVAVGEVASQQGMDFSLTVTLPQLERESETIKIRLLPGPPKALKINSITRNGIETDCFSNEETSHYRFDIENNSMIALSVCIVDIAGNVTLERNVTVQAKFPTSSGIDKMTTNCADSGRGTLSGQIFLKKLKDEKTVTAKISAYGKKEIMPILCEFHVKPSSEVSTIEVFHSDPFSDSDELTRVKTGSDIYWQAGEVMSNLSFRLLDEGRREVELSRSVCSCLKVNWTKNVPPSVFRSGTLPNVRAPKNVLDTMYCEIVYSGLNVVQFSFNIKPFAGEPAAIRCNILGNKTTQLGVIRTDPISVTLQDELGNKLNVKQSQLPLIRVNAEGLDESLIEKVIEDGCVLLTNVQFNQGPLGGREMCISYEEMKESVVMRITAGTPVTLKVLRWHDVSKPYTVLSGSKMQDLIEVQLMDGWGFPAQQKGVKILLGKESALKLTPNPGMLLTDENGYAKFNRFSVSAKRGEYHLQPRAVINRTSIEGPKLKIAVLPNTETPCAIKVTYNNTSSVQAGTKWPDFDVTVTSEEGCAVTSQVNLCMAIWKGEPFKDKVVPSNAKLHRTDQLAVGIYKFSEIPAPSDSHSYCICFCLCESRHSRNFTMYSKVIQMFVDPGPPHLLQHEIDPGTPTASNTNLAKTIVTQLALVLHDKYGNMTGKDVDTEITVSIQASDECLRSTEIPIFDKNKGILQFHMRNGRVLLKDISLKENSPGRDGAQYTLLCEVATEKIVPYQLKFLFYNDAVKQNQMSILIKKRDMLKNAIDSYQSLFTLHKTLLAELKKTLKEAENKKKQTLRDLQKYSFLIPPSHSVDDIEDMIMEMKKERAFLQNEPRRRCLLKEYPDKSSDILGKIGHLAYVEDEDIATVLSWHMMGDMDCLITFTSAKAKEVHRMTGGSQQVLPLDSIYRKNLPDNSRPLPHMKRGVAVSRVNGNPVFARQLLHFTKDPENCKVVFGMLLGETLILDDLESANEYRNQVVKFTYCPTILTRTGERIRSNGKFGGNQNRASSIDRLRGVVFGAPEPAAITEKDRLIEFLVKLKDSVQETDAALMELNSHEASLETDEMLKKKIEHQEALGRLRDIESKIQTSSPRSPAPRQKLTGSAPPKRRRR